LLDLSGPYQVALRPGAAPRPLQMADPFHVVRLANCCVDLVRRRVQKAKPWDTEAEKAIRSIGYGAC